MSEYWIVLSDSPGGLETAVLEALRAGWTPQGGVAVTRDDFGANVYMQAMVKP